ncbi:PAAR domain-containing protein [Acinetobacter baumannii]|uniref:PAAR domain-containing protein n=1 Tax=Acinetobacter baumannii TaxID=470 RepID=UPI0038D07646
MATPYITIGCPTTGGEVISGNSSFLIDGIAVACVGDKQPAQHIKLSQRLYLSHPNMQIFGKAAARVNDSLSCGCKLLPKQNLVVQTTAVEPLLLLLNHHQPQCLKNNQQQTAL